MAFVDDDVSYAIFFVSLGTIAIYAVIVSWRLVPSSVDDFFSARNSQGALALGWSFFASGMGSWTILTVPTVGRDVGTLGMLGYTISCCTPLLVLALVGPKLRKELGDGFTWSSYLNQRLGMIFQIYISLWSILFQAVCLIAEFTGLKQAVTSISPNVNGTVIVVSTALVTALYTMVGGLRASIATDVYQGVGVLMLVIMVTITIICHVDIPDGAWKETNAAGFTEAGAYTFFVMIFAVTASNLFLTGFWQRVWAARDDRQLRIGCAFASAITVPFMVVLGVVGIVSAAAQIAQGEYDLPFFIILAKLPEGWQWIVIGISVALVSSSADTIQNGIAAEFPIHLFPSINPSNKLIISRVITVIVTIPCVILAVENVNVFEVYLIADLVMACAVVPMLLSHWKALHPIAAAVGLVSGPLSVIIYAVGKGMPNPFRQFLLPEYLYTYDTLITFVIATGVPLCVTIFVNFVLRAIGIREEDRLSNCHHEYDLEQTPAAQVIDKTIKLID